MGEKTKELDQGEQDDCTDIVSCSVPDATDEVHHFCVKLSPVSRIVSNQTSEWVLNQN